LARHAEFNVGSVSKVTVGHHLDATLTAEPVELLTGVEGVDFDLEYSWFDLRVLKYLSEHRSADVTASNVTYESFLD
jgi:hypothetical protein